MCKVKTNVTAVRYITGLLIYRPGDLHTLTPTPTPPPPPAPIQHPLISVQILLLGPPPHYFAEPWLGPGQFDASPKSAICRLPWLL